MRNENSKSFFDGKIVGGAVAPVILLSGFAVIDGTAPSQSRLGILLSGSKTRTLRRA